MYVLKESCIPFWLHDSDRPDELFRRHDKFIEDHPLRRGAKAAGWVKADGLRGNFVRNGPPCLLSSSYLIVLHGRMPAPPAALVRNLHEVSVHECHPDVSVEALVTGRYRDKFDPELLHLSLQLSPDIVGLHHCAL